LGKMKDVSGEGRTVLYVSHNLPSIENLCNSIIWIDKGKCIESQKNVRSTLNEYISSNYSSKKYELIHYKKYNTELFDLEQVYLTNNKQKKVEHNIFTPSDDIRLIIEGVINKNDPNLRIGFELKDSNGETLFFSFNTDINHKIAHAINKEVKIETIIPRNLLNEGEYTLHPRIDLYHIKDLNEHELEFINFRIQGKMSESNFYTHSRPGKIAPLLDWNSHLK